MGDYAKQADPDLLMARDGNDHPTGTADLLGCRLAACTETNEGRRFDEAKLKRVSGEDRIKARYLYQNFFEFVPTHKLWLACNHKPVVRGTDYAFWRRLRLIPFNVTIPAEERDQNLSAKLRDEASGILAWCVEGCLLWQAEGLNPPSEVVAATGIYQGEQDVIGRFITERCEQTPDARVWAGDLYARYGSWAKAGGEFVASQTKFGAKLTEMGFTTEKSMGMTRRVGLRLREQSGEGRDSWDGFSETSFVPRTRAYFPEMVSNYPYRPFLHTPNTILREDAR